MTGLFHIRSNIKITILLRKKFQVPLPIDITCGMTAHYLKIISDHHRQRQLKEILGGQTCELAIFFFWYAGFCIDQKLVFKILDFEFFLANVHDIHSKSSAKWKKHRIRIKTSFDWSIQIVFASKLYSSIAFFLLY